MMEFLYNIWLGILENKDKILMILTSTEFVGLIGLLTAVVRSNKKTNENTNSTKALNTSVTKISDFDDRLKGIGDDVDSVLCNNKIEENLLVNIDRKIESNTEVINAKIDAMLEVQSIVYSSIKDERVRSTVNSILSSAKYANDHTKEELRKQVEELKAEVNDKSKELVKLVEDRSNKVSAMVSTPTARMETQEVIERY